MMVSCSSDDFLDSENNAKAKTTAEFNLQMQQNSD